MEAMWSPGGCHSVQGGQGAVGPGAEPMLGAWELGQKQAQRDEGKTALPAALPCEVTALFAGMMLRCGALCSLFIFCE